MKKYTVEDLNTFERDENGFLQCPTGNYSAIKEFPKYCDFGPGSIIGPYSRIGVGSTIGAYSIIGEYSTIGTGSRIGAGSRIGGRISISEGVIIEPGCYIEDNKPLKQYFSMEGCGSERRKTHFFLLTDNRIYIRCGCFAGYEDEFIEKVHETHKGNLYEKQYFAALELAKLTFQEERDKAGESKNEGQG